MNADIELLLENTSRKREALRDEASAKRRYRRLLSAASGILAFLSGASILSLLSTYLQNSDAAKVVAALLAFLSTFVTILTQTFFDDKETLKMWQGAAEFLALREKILDTMANYKDMTDKTAQKAIADVRKEYVKTSTKYEAEIPEEGLSRRFPASGRTIIVPKTGTGDEPDGGKDAT
jgi:Zn-dependent protease with chaperone function